MQPNTQSPQPKTSHKASITGFILAILSLISSGIANWLIHVEYTPNGPTTGTVGREVGHAVATATTHTLGALFGMMFIVGGVVFGLVSIVFVLLRLRKVRIAGWLFSIVAVLVVVWSFSVSIGLLDVIKAKS